MKDILNVYVKQLGTKVLQIPQITFRSTWDHNVIIQNNDKEYKLVFTKRVLLDSFKTRPFGYKTKNIIDQDHTDSNL